MTRHLVLIAAAVCLLAACKKEGGAPADSPKADSAKADAPKAAPAAGAANGRAEVEAAGALALPMCSKNIDGAAWSDFKTTGKPLTARYPNPLPKPGDDGDGTAFDWVGTKAGVTYDDDDFIYVMMVTDDTDPCALDSNGDLMTSKKNPAAKIQLVGKKTGDLQNWSPGSEGPKVEIGFGSSRNGNSETASFGSQIFARVTKFEAGKAVEFDLHGCYAQTGSMMGAPQRDFALGHVSATWCPKKP